MLSEYMLEQFDSAPTSEFGTLQMEYRKKLLLIQSVVNKSKEYFNLDSISKLYAPELRSFFEPEILYLKLSKKIDYKPFEPIIKLAVYGLPVLALRKINEALDYVIRSFTFMGEFQDIKARVDFIEDKVKELMDTIFQYYVSCHNIAEVTAGKLKGKIMSNIKETAENAAGFLNITLDDLSFLSPGAINVIRNQVTNEAYGGRGTSVPVTVFNSISGALGQGLATFTRGGI